MLDIFIHVDVNKSMINLNVPIVSYATFRALKISGFGAQLTKNLYAFRVRQRIQHCRRGNQVLDLIFEKRHIAGKQTFLSNTSRETIQITCNLVCIIQQSSVHYLKEIS